MDLSCFDDLQSDGGNWPDAFVPQRNDADDSDEQGLQEERVKLIQAVRAFCEDLCAAQGCLWCVRTVITQIYGDRKTLSSFSAHRDNVMRIHTLLDEIQTTYDRMLHRTLNWEYLLQGASSGGQIARMIKQLDITREHIDEKAFDMNRLIDRNRELETMFDGFFRHGL